MSRKFNDSGNTGDSSDLSDSSAALETAYRHALRFHEARHSQPPAASADFNALLEAFGGPTPETGAPAAEVIERLVVAAEPGLMGTAGARFFSWVVGGSHPVGVAADWLTSVWGQNAGCYQGAPAGAVAEQVAAQWLVDILHLPRECSVGFTTGATMSNFVCLAAARGALLRRVGWDVELDGMFGAPPITVCIGDDAHASVLASLRYLGFGERRVVRIATDEAGRMKVAALRVALARCPGPLIVIAQAGHIMTGAFDPIDDIATLTQARGGWLHVDGAFGLWARASPARAHLARGFDRADSWATDAHKWLQAPYECGCAFVRDADAHRRAMTIGASYLPDAGDAIRDPLHYAPELSRRARGFALWALLRAFGREGVAAMIERHCVLAGRMAQRLAVVPGIEILNEVALNQFVVQFGAGEAAQQHDALTVETIARIQAAGVCHAAGARWRGREVMRVSVISWPTTEEDIDRAADSMIAAWRGVRGRHAKEVLDERRTAMQA
ncbi:pyridoxal phosphate-dependent decarboxylase family protein [Paraburkholderia aromaticivorans]|uniref:pyridoxal phosphate-dependent decarboxylase family protein n=1 Tax=Paraburkholderia aromaticivorans TaxID=2026199 RepID=UPI001F0EE040|nr:aminotransferase class V-fold PLP-dependent enzyme [Paraburkholderia aromaticivorans]